MGLTIVLTFAIDFVYINIVCRSILIFTTLHLTTDSIRTIFKLTEMEFNALQNFIH